MSKTEPLEGWVKTTLWFILMTTDAPRWEFNVWSPQHCSDQDYERLMERASQQVVKVLRNFVGATVIIQGNYGKARGEEYRP